MPSDGYASAQLAEEHLPAQHRPITVAVALSLVIHLLVWSRLDHTPSQPAAAPFTPSLAVTLHSTATTQSPAASAHREIAAPPRPTPANTQIPSAHSAEITPEKMAASATSSTTEQTTAPTAESSSPLVIQPPSHNAAYLHNPEPAYPRVARRRQLEGTVVIRAQVGTSGECLTAMLHQSSGHEILDQAALSAVGQWRFTPARRGDELVSAWVDVPIIFRLARL